MFLIKFQEYFEKMYSCSGALIQNTLIYQIAEAYLEPKQASAMKVFWEYT